MLCSGDVVVQQVGTTCPGVFPPDRAEEAIPVEKIRLLQSKQVIKSLLEVSLRCPHLSLWSL